MITTYKSIAFNIEIMKTKELNIQSTVYPEKRLDYNDYQLYLRKQLGIKVNVKLYKTGKL